MGTIGHLKNGKKPKSQMSKKNYFMSLIISSLLLICACDSTEDDPVIKNKFCKSEWQEVETISANGESKEPEYITTIIFTTDGRVLGTQVIPDGASASNMTYHLFKNGGIDYERGGSGQSLKYTKYTFSENYLNLSGDGTDGKFVTTYKPIKEITPRKSSED